MREAVGGLVAQRQAEPGSGGVYPESLPLLKGLNGSVVHLTYRKDNGSRRVVHPVRRHSPPGSSWARTQAADAWCRTTGPEPFYSGRSTLDEFGWTDEGWTRSGLGKGHSMAIREFSEAEQVVDGFRGIVGYGITEEWERSVLVRQLVTMMPSEDGFQETAGILGIDADQVVRYVTMANEGKTGLH